MVEEAANGVSRELRGDREFLVLRLATSSRFR